MEDVTTTIPDGQVVGESSESDPSAGRSVWVLARPTSLAGLVAPLSKGKYPICHWGILFSPHTKVDLNVIWMSKRSRSSPGHQVWGTLIELKRTAENTNTARVTTDFGLQHIQQEWAFSSITYIGQTQLDDTSLVRRAQEIVTDYPDYNVIWNNCQKFVYYLIETASPGNQLPTTLEAVFLSFSTFFQSPTQDVETPIPGAYPRSSRIRTLTASGESTEFFTAVEFREEEADEHTSNANESDATQVAASVEEFLALWKNDEMKDTKRLYSLNPDIGREIENILHFHGEIENNELESHVSVTMWIYFILIMDCQSTYLNYMKGWTTSNRPVWMSRRSLFRKPAAMKNESTSTFYGFEAGERTLRLAQSVFLLCNFGSRVRLENGGVELSPSEIQRGFMDALQVSKTRDLNKYRKLIREGTLHSLTGWRIRMGWFGGLRRFTECMVACIRLEGFLDDYKRELALVLTSTFIFHRGRFPIGDVNIDALPSQKFGETAMQLDSNNIDI